MGDEEVDSVPDEEESSDIDDLDDSEDEEKVNSEAIIIETVAYLQ